VDISNNPLNEEAANELLSRVTRNDYTGPRINMTLTRSALRLRKAVAVWLSPPGDGAKRGTRQWLGFASEPGAAAFSRFLERLARTGSATNPEFRQSTGEWLDQLENRAALRQTTFGFSHDASASCDDRVCKALNEMRQLRLADDVEQGHYDQRLPDLLDLGRGMFRLRELERIAHEKAESLAPAALLRGEEVDEIEVYLAYQVRLRETLALPLDVAEMRFFNASHVTQADLDAAEVSVRQAEQQGFADYLATRWQPWQSVLNRLEPQAHEAASEALIEAMGEPFANRLQARLREMGLENDDGAKIQAGASVSKEIEREIMGPLTQNFLVRNGLQIHPLGP
jgi:hypothetical protein